MNIQIKQLTDKQGNRIAPNTPEHSIYDSNGVRLDTKLNNMNKNIYPRIIKSEDELNELIEAGGPFEEGYDYLAYEDNEESETETESETEETSENG